MTLTPHAVALARAAEATGRIEQRMLMLRRSGKLREFTSAYKRRRVAAGKRAGVTTPRCTDEVGLAPIFLALTTLYAHTCPEERAGASVGPEIRRSPLLKLAL